MRTNKASSPRNQQLTVVVRIRPLFPHELEKGASKIVRKVDEKMVVLSDPSAGDPVDILRAKRAHDRKYVFDWAFDEHSSQEEVYEKTTKSLVENVVDGYNGTVFAYGATGSGKTYTMVGDQRNPGIMVRALNDLFSEVETKNKVYQVTMSYLEIYNENIRDLLNPSAAQLELREDAGGNHQVAGLSEVEIASSEQVMSLLMRGNTRRSQESTGANAVSSRSHAVLTVRVRRRSEARDRAQTVRTGSLYMIDLAGSERAAHTQNTGKRLLEGAHINKSLLALGNCINALAERSSRYVNFRDSKLTRLLKEPLSGNCRTVMVGHLSPAHPHFEESRNTLLYADRAKNITTKLRSNVSEAQYHVAQYQSIIDELRQEIVGLRRRIRQSGEEDSQTDDKKLTTEEMKLLKKQLIEAFNAQMDVRRRLMDIDTHLLRQRVDFNQLGMVIGEYIDLRESCQSEYSSCKAKTLGVTESLAQKASSREQRELLHLLARVYELEIEKLELQSSQLSREHELRCRDLAILRYDRQRQLCEEIITRQRRLIDALVTNDESHGSDARTELNELYRIYQQEVQDLNNGRNSDLGPFGLCYRPPSTGVLRPLGNSGSMLELHQLDLNGNASAAKTQNPLPPISNIGEGAEQERKPLFERRREPFRPSSDDASLPPLGHLTSSNSSRSSNDARLKLRYYLQFMAVAL
ncbi:kinesin-like protein KIF19 [Uloborus diversus]|uniref:kinesin-like protein KIF19 n=1 Tax=Uloborus diversus TaxID=327109 RepID=UPI0024091DD9|nr:kinesin-like protein KIF19 [Uloborus diversus]